MLSAGVAFLGNVLVARHLGPGDFNSFYLLFAVMSVVAGLTGPAIDGSLVRFAARHITRQRDNSWPYFKFVLYLKGAILVCTLLLGGLLAQPLIRVLFSDVAEAHASGYAIVLAFFGGAVVSLWGFAQAYFQAHMRFVLSAAYECFSSFLRLALVAGVIALGFHNTELFLGLYVAAPLTVALVAWFQLPTPLFHAPTSMAVGKEFIQFAKWSLVSTIFATMTQKLDLILLNLHIFAIPKEAIGQYSAAVSVVLAGELVLVTFFNVLLPKASALQDPGADRLFIRELRIPSLLLCLGLGLMMPLAGPFSRIVFGSQYASTGTYFTILILGIIVALACAPATAVLYARGHARAIAGFEGLRLAATLVLGTLIIPQFGLLGMAFVVTLVRALANIVMYMVALRLCRAAAIT